MSAYGLNISSQVGVFVVGETVQGLTSLATATVLDLPTNQIIIDYATLSGTFLVGETVTGLTSTATAILDSIFYNSNDIFIKAFLYDKNTWLPLGGFVYDIKHAILETQENLVPRFDNYDNEIVDNYRLAYSDQIKYLGIEEISKELALSTGFYYINNQAHYLYSDVSAFEVISSSGGLSNFVDNNFPLTIARYILKNNIKYFEHVYDFSLSTNIVTFNEPIPIERTDIFDLTGSLDANGDPFEVFHPTYWPPTAIIDATFNNAAFSGTVSVSTDGTYRLKVDNSTPEIGPLRITYSVGAAVSYEKDSSFPGYEIDNILYPAKEVYLTELDENNLVNSNILYIGNLIGLLPKYIKISHGNSIDNFDFSSFAGEMVQFKVKTLDATNAPSPFADFIIESSVPIGTINGWRNAMFGQTGSSGDLRINYIAPFTTADMGIAAVIDGGDNTQVISSYQLNLDDTYVFNGLTLEPKILLAVDDGERFVLLTDVNGDKIAATGLEDVLGETNFTLPAFRWDLVTKVKFPVSLATLPAGTIYILTPQFVTLSAKLLDGEGLVLPGTFESFTKIGLRFDYKTLELEDGRIESVFFLDADVAPTIPTPDVPTFWDSLTAPLENSPKFSFVEVITTDQLFKENQIRFRFIIEKK